MLGKFSNNESIATRWPFGNSSLGAEWVTGAFKTMALQKMAFLRRIWSRLGVHYHFILFKIYQIHQQILASWHCPRPFWQCQELLFIMFLFRLDSIGPLYLWQCFVLQCVDNFFMRVCPAWRLRQSFVLFVFLGAGQPSRDLKLCWRLNKYFMKLVPRLVARTGNPKWILWALYLWLQFCSCQVSRNARHWSGGSVIESVSISLSSSFYESESSKKIRARRGNILCSRNESRKKEEDFFGQADRQGLTPWPVMVRSHGFPWSKG